MYVAVYVVAALLIRDHVVHAKHIQPRYNVTPITHIRAGSSVATGAKNNSRLALLLHLRGEGGCSEVADVSSIHCTTIPSCATKPSQTTFSMWTPIIDHEYTILTNLFHVKPPLTTNYDLQHQRQTLHRKKKQRENETKTVFICPQDTVITVW